MDNSGINFDKIYQDTEKLRIEDHDGTIYPDMKKLSNENVYGANGVLKKEEELSPKLPSEIKKQQKKQSNVGKAVKSFILGITLTAVALCSTIAFTGCDNTPAPTPGPDIPPIVTPPDPEVPEPGPVEPDPDPEPEIDKDAPVVAEGAETFEDINDLYAAVANENLSIKVLRDKAQTNIRVNDGKIETIEGDKTIYAQEKENGFYFIKKIDDQWKEVLSEDYTSVADMLETLLGSASEWNYNAETKTFSNATSGLTLSLDGGLASFVGKTKEEMPLKLYIFNAGVTNQITLPEITPEISLEEKIAASKQAFIDSVYKTVDYIQTHRDTEWRSDLGDEKINKVVTVKFDETNKKKVTVFLDVDSNVSEGVTLLKSYTFEVKEDINIENITATGTFTGFEYAPITSRIGTQIALNKDSSNLSETNYAKFKDKFKLNEFDYVHVATGQSTNDRAWEFTTFKNGIKTEYRIRAAAINSADKVFETLVLTDKYTEDKNCWGLTTTYYNLSDANTLGLSDFQQTEEEMQF